MNGELDRLRRTEIWIAWVRVFAVPFAAFEVAIVGSRHRPATSAGAGRPRPR